MADTAAHSPDDRLARVVVEYNELFKALVNKAGQPGFGIGEWDALAAYVATDEFERVGSFKEVVNWPQYVQLVHGWASTCTYDNVFKSVTQAGNRVFLELEETNTSGANTDVVNSLTVWDFNDAGKLRHLAIYLQQAPQPSWGSDWKIGEV